MSTAADMGLPWNEHEPSSPTRHNAKDVIWATGNQLQALGSQHIWPGKIIFCTANSTDLTFIKDTCYQRNSANNAWTSISLKKHSHNSDSAEAGGLYTQIKIDNAIIDNTIDRMHATVEMWNQFVSGSGTVTDVIDSGRIDLKTNTTTNSSASVFAPGIKMWFNRPMRSVVKAQALGNNTNVLCRFGVRAERVFDAVDINNKFGAEFCDGTGVNFQIFSANGVTRSTTATTFTGISGAASSYRFDYTPSTSVVMTKDGTSFVTKTSNVPATGNTDADDIFTAGIKNTDANFKTLEIWGMITCGQSNDQFD